MTHVVTDVLKLQEAGLLDNDSEESPVEADGSEASEEQTAEKVHNLWKT